jgi:hypothetical protein
VTYRRVLVITAACAIWVLLVFAVAYLVLGWAR